jgi:riboflavin synthase
VQQVRNLSSALKEPPLILSGAGSGQRQGRREAALWRFGGVAV